MASSIQLTTWSKSLRDHIRSSCSSLWLYLFLLSQPQVWEVWGERASFDILQTCQQRSPEGFDMHCSPLLGIIHLRVHLARWPSLQPGFYSTVTSSEKSSLATLPNIAHFSLESLALAYFSLSTYYLKNYIFICLFIGPSSPLEYTLHDGRHLILLSTEQNLSGHGVCMAF